MTFRERIVDIVHKAATSSRAVRIPLTPLGATFFLLLTASFVVLARQLDNMLQLPKFLSEPLNLYLAVPVLAAGTSLCLWTVILFFRAKGTPVPINPPNKLVISGPYAYCRNPMLTSVFLLLFGLAILFQSFSLFFIFTPLYILLHVAELKLIEEPELTKRFGDAYLDYKECTPMFVPSLRSDQGHSRTRRQ